VTRYEIYCGILATGLINIRMAAAAGSTKQCFAESDHLHNMPDLLLDIENKEKQIFYAKTMRSSYLSITEPEWPCRYKWLWEELDKLDSL